MAEWPERFCERVIPEPMSGCYLWIGGQNGDGYGTVFVGHRLVGAHRVAWALKNGPIPVGRWVLHKCDNPPCVNPDHLFLGDNAANMADMVRKGRRYDPAPLRRAAVACVNGHPYTPDNVLRSRNGRRCCRACKRVNASNRQGQIADRRDAKLARERDRYREKREEILARQRAEYRERRASGLSR